MKQSNMYFGLAGIIIVLLIAFFVTRTPRTTVVAPITLDGVAVASSTDSSSGISTTPPGTKSPVPNVPFTPVIPANYNTYTSDKYDFSLGYPKTLTLNNGFSSFHRLNNQWRMGAEGNVQGTPLLQIDLFKVDHATPVGSPYPLFYTAAVRGAVSTNVKECYSTDGGKSILTGTQNIGGIEWKVFTYNDVNGTEYVKSKNYRHVRGSTCFVLEQVATGSTLKDSTMKPGMSDLALQGLFDSGFDVIKTFRFK